jgi:hypothetical protein
MIIVDRSPGLDGRSRVTKTSTLIVRPLVDNRFDPLGMLIDATSLAIVGIGRCEEGPISGGLRFRQANGTSWLAEPYAGKRHQPTTGEEAWNQ